MSDFRHSLEVMRAVLGNPALRRVEIAFAGFNAAEWAVWIAMLVYAYDVGGATTAGIVAFAQLVPATFSAPLAGALADRYPAARMLTAGYVAQTAAMAATALALVVGGPPLLVYALAALATCAVTSTRPAQAVVIPALARTPDELTAANAVSGWIESVGVLAGPVTAGILLNAAGPGSVFAVMAGVALLSALAVANVPGPHGSRAEGGLGLSDELTAGFSALRERGEARLLVGLLGAQYIVIGALDVLFVVLALDVLHIGEGGAAYLNAAFGAGGVLAIAATATMVGRLRLVPALMLGAAAWSLALVAIGLVASTVAAVGLFVLAGVGRNVFDVAGRTLLQRAAPGHVLARVFGVLEALTMAGLAIGSLLASGLVALGGAETATAGIGGLLPALALLAGARLLAVDRSADVPVVEISLLRSLPMMAALDPPVLEGLARGLIPVTAAPGETLIREGDPGDRFYVVADGELDVTCGDASMPRLVRGDGFGEIALLDDRPRTATVTARTRALLYALERGDFLGAVSGDPRAANEARHLADERLVRAGSAPAPGRSVPL